ncbi:MAG: hypothetical protein J6O09_02140, partial [Lachnospiraceae bacterium]|nr:hypothetical protein [Lachnospiraceae bacterium]
MNKASRLIKRYVALILVLLFSIESFAAVVGDNDGAAFITKAEFDSMKNDFQSQLDRYNSSLDNKIDGAIASYLAGVGIEKRTLLKNAISNYALLRFYNDFKFWGRVWKIDTSRNKTVGDLKWNDLQVPRSSRGSRGGVVGLTWVDHVVNAGWNPGTDVVQIEMRYSNPTNTDWMTTGGGAHVIMPHETFQLKKNDNNEWYVYQWRNDDSSNRYWNIACKPVNRGSVSERVLYIYSDNSESQLGKIHVALGDATGYIINLTMTGFGTTNKANDKHDIDFNMKPKASDIFTGMHQIYSTNTWTSESVSGLAVLGANTSVTIDKELAAVVPYNWGVVDAMLKYGSFPWDETKQFEAWKYDENDNVDYSDVTEYNPANLTIEMVTLAHGPLTDWGYPTSSRPFANNIEQPTGTFSLPIAPIYKLKDSASGTFVRPDKSLLKYCDGLQLVDGLIDNGTIEINFKIIGKNSKTGVTNTSDTCKIYIGNTKLDNNATFLKGTIMNGGTVLYQDRAINGLELDYGKTYKITIENYKINDKDNGDDLYL